MSQVDSAREALVAAEDTLFELRSSLTATPVEIDLAEQAFYDAEDAYYDALDAELDGFGSSLIWGW